ncbi:MAG TPA: hypothetical protein VE988_29975 [Gemmataceae bacterium]|nr:hypothetical protein [Gemmataceae bacterium]
MNSNGKANGWFDGNLYIVNRNKFPLGELQKYAGQYVAFSTQGTQILASHNDPLELAALLDKAGYQSTDWVCEQIWADEVGLK